MSKSNTINELEAFKDDQIQEVWHLAGGGDCACAACSWPKEEGGKK